MPSTVRIATFNIRHGAVAGSRRVDVDLLAKACVGLHADVLALQEVDAGTHRTGGADLAAAVADATRMRAVFAATLGRFGGGQYGNALLVRGELDDVDVLTLPKGWRFWTRREPRNAILAEVTVGDGLRLSVGATHLSVQRWASREQLPALLRALDRRPAPRVVLGDLNRTPAEVARIGRLGGYRLAAGAATFPNRLPVGRIDHIAVAGLDIVAEEVVATPVSDHRALVVTARLPSPTQ